MSERVTAELKGRLKEIDTVMAEEAEKLAASAAAGTSQIVARAEEVAAASCEKARGDGHR